MCTFRGESGIGKILSGIPSEILNAPIHPGDILEICKHDFDWEDLLRMLGLSESRILQIRRQYRDPEDQKHQALRRWREMKGGEATYRALITAAVTIEEGSLAHDVVGMLRNRQTPSTAQEGASYASHKAVSDVSGEPHKKKISVRNLLQFPYRIGERQSLNIIAAAAPQYRELGTLLLDDRSYIIDDISMTYRSPYDAMRAVFDRWIKTGNDVSWKKLIECLKDIDLNVLAEKLSKSLGDSGDLD